MKSKFITKLKDWNENAQGHEKKLAVLNFLSSVTFMFFLGGAETHAFAKYFHICELKSKFLTKLKDSNENAQAHGKKLHS